MIIFDKTPINNISNVLQTGEERAIGWVGKNPD